MRSTKKSRLALRVGQIALPMLVLLGLSIWYFSHHTVAILQPAGPIAEQERNLLFIGLLLALVVVIPVYTMTIIFAIRYRANNHKARYEPDWDHNLKLELAWWAIPLVIITILSVITWVSSHQLDPFKPLAVSGDPLTVQVVALDWKWLFIYPKQNIASVNLLEIPANTPINLQLTSDTVMNSFWVPQLSGQIYAMPGMSTQLHLMASRTGSFYGSPANIAGAGFARMTFTVKSVKSADFKAWAATAKYNGTPLTLTSYKQLAIPSDDNPVKYFAPVKSGLYNYLVMKYLGPRVLIRGGN